MGYTKLSVTIPEELYQNAKDISNTRHIKLSHLVADALRDKLQKIKEEKYISQLNKIFTDPETASAQRDMAESIADNTDVEELPW